MDNVIFITEKIFSFTFQFRPVEGYVLLKVIKKELISKAVGENCLTSYTGTKKKRPFYKVLNLLNQ